MTHGPFMNGSAAGAPPGTGGAATAAGVAYQALWVLLQAAEATLVDAHKTADGHLDELCLILEPYAGDAQLLGPQSRRVVQLKTLTSGTWSLKDVIVQVLPNLYRAVTLPPQGEEVFEFVTEGRRGEWDSVERFFLSLQHRAPDPGHDSGADQAADGLDDSKPLKFRGSNGPFWSGFRPTERGVFDRIVEYVRSVGAAPNESPDQTRRKARHLLSRFRFEGGNAREWVRAQIDALLLGVVEDRDRLANIREAMVGWLIERSDQNNTRLTPQELFDHCGLGGVVPVKRAVVHEGCKSRVRAAAACLGYRHDWDVRDPALLTSCSEPHATLIAVTGECGCGKSWHLFAEALAATSTAVVLIDSKGDAETDLQRVADRVWHDVLRHESSMSIGNLAARFADVLGPERGVPWLTVCIDRLSPVAAATGLLGLPLEDWGLRLIIGCDPHIAAALEQRSRADPQRVVVVRLDDFTVAERDEYLRRRVGDHRAQIPSDVADLLKRPQLAGMYADLVCGQQDVADGVIGWHPQNEYDLVDRYWKRLESGENAEHPFDAAHLQRLAGEVLDGAAYPWTAEQLMDDGVDDDATWRLTRCGWLHRLEDGRYAIPHDRLLNFAIAQALVSRRHRGELDAQRMGDLLRRLRADELRAGPTQLGYAPLDWFYLMTRSEDTRDAATETLAVLQEQLQEHDRADMARELLPTLEAGAVPLLKSRLISAAQRDRSLERAAAVDGLATRPIEELRGLMRELLCDPNPRVRRCGLGLLFRKPAPELLDVAWQLHKEMQLDPIPFSEDDGRDGHFSRYLAYQDAFRALRACVRESPAWLVRAIEHADPAIEPVHDLAYLVADLDDGGATWRACKAQLFSKVSPEKRRALAFNVGNHCDRDEVDRIAQWVSVEGDHTGPAVVRALARVDAPRAIESMRHLAEQSLCLYSGWFVPPLLVAEREATLQALFERIASSDKPLRTAMVYHGHESDMDCRTVELLLNELERELRRILGRPPAEDGSPIAEQRGDGNSLYQPLNLLASVGRADLLECFAARAGSSLEDELVRFLIEVVGPQRGSMRSGLSREPGLLLLLKIDGSGYRRVVNAYLRVDDYFGLLDALHAAVRDADSDTIEQLRITSTRDEPPDAGTRLLRMEAMRALAAHGDGTGLLTAMLHRARGLPADIMAWLKPHATPDPALLRRAKELLSADDVGQLEAAVFGVGVFGATEAVADLVRLLEQSRSEQVRRAIMLSLSLLGPAGAPATCAIARELPSEDNRPAAVGALTSIGSPEALERLLQSLEERWDAGLAVWLADRPGGQDRPRELLTRRLQALADAPVSEWRDDLAAILGQASDELLRVLLRACPSTIQDRLREDALVGEGSFWVVGSKARAIRGLAAFDPDAAWLAAESALMNARCHDRHLYAPLLSALDGGRARALFLSLASLEKSRAVLWSMAHSIEDREGEWLREQLAAGAGSQRLAGCRLAGATSVADLRTMGCLEALAADSSSALAESAIGALWHMRHQLYAEDLAKRLAEELRSPGIRCWSLAESLLLLGDPGYEDTALPMWLRALRESDALQNLPSLWKVTHTKLAEKRKEASTKDQRQTAEI